MKYFNFFNKNNKKLLSNNDLDKLDKNQKKKKRRNKILIKGLTVIGTFFFLILVACCVFLISLIPKPSQIFLLILYVFGTIILGFIGLIISMFLTGITFSLLIDKVNYKNKLNVELK